MAVHRLTTVSPPTTPRRSPRLPTRKRARASDSEQQLPPSSSKLPLNPDPSPRCIRAQKRQKILDGSSRASPPLPAAAPIIDNSITRAGKRKSLIPHDHHESDSHHRVPKKKRKKENIVNDALTANATSSSLKISMTLDTRQGAGNNLHRDEKNTGQSQSLRNTRSKSTFSVPDSKSKPKFKLHFTSAAVPSDPSCDPSSSSRMMTRTMRKLSQHGATAQARLAPAGSTHTYTTRSHTFAPGSNTILPPTSVSASTIPSPSDISQSTVTQSDIPTSDLASNSTSTTTTTFSDAITNDAHDTAASIQSSSTPNISSSETTPPPLSKSPSISMPLPVSISLPISFMDVPLQMPLNLAYLNMPLSMPLSMPLNVSISADISTTLAPSESELGFGFQPQEEFSSTGREDGQSKGNGEDGKGGTEGEHVFPQQLSTPPLLTPTRPTTSESTITRSSPDIFLDRPSSPPPQSCTPCLNPTSTTPTRIPPRLVIPTCLTDQPPPTSTSPTSPTSSSSYPSFINSTSPTHSSPLKVVCFPSLPEPQQHPFPSTSQWQPSPSPSTLEPQQLSSLPPSSAHERRIKEWAMDMAGDHCQTERALEQEMGVELSLSFRNSSTGQGDELRLAQQEMEEEQQDRSPLLGPAPQPSTPQPPAAPYPQLAPSFPSCPPSPTCCSSSSSGSPSSTSRQYQHHQIPEWTPKLDKERNLWKLACKIRVWEITKRYTPDTIRTVVAQEAHDYYSAHGFPLGYGSVPVRSRRRRWRKIVSGAGSNTMATAGSDSDCSSSIMVSTPSPRDDDFMNEETYSFELMDDDEDMDGSLSGGVGLGDGGLRSMEDEWRYEGFEDDEFGFDDDEEDDDDDDEDYDDLYEDVDDEVDEVVEGDGDRTKISENKKKKGDVSYIAGGDQDQDPDAEGEMEIDIEPFQDPSFNAELSSPTSPTSPTSSTTSSKSKSKSKSDSGVGDEPQSFVSSFYIPPVPPHVQHMLQMQQQQQQGQEEEAPVLASSPLDSTTNPLSSSLEGTPISTFDTVDHSTTAAPNDENNQTPMQIHLPPATHHPHHYHSQLIPFSSNILPLPPPRLDSVRVFILRQSEMGGLKTTGRGTPADRKRGAIWGGVQVGGGREVGTSRNKRGLDDGSESESDEDNSGEDEGGKRGRPRLRLMLSDHDIGTGSRRDSREGEGGDGTKTSLKLSLLDDIDEVDEQRMPVGFKCDISESSSNANNDQNNHHRTPTPKPSSTFVATDQTWDAFLASLDDKNHQPPQQQQGEEGTFDSSVTAADSDTTHGQLLLDLDGHHHHHLPDQHRLHRERDPPPHEVTTTTTRRLGPSLSPTASLEGSSGMFMFDHEGGDDGSTSTWFGDEGGGLRSSSSSSSSNLGVGVGGLVVVGSSGTCPSDALAMDGFNFPVGPDGSSTLSYALG